MKRVCIVVSHPGTLHSFLVYQLSVLSTSFDVSVVANGTSSDLSFLPDQIRFFPIRVERKPHPIHDLVAAWRLFRLFRNERFDLVHSMTPKAGLLAMMASSAARVSSRFHTFVGEVWATRRGPWRSLLKNADRLTARLATDVLAVSPSELEFLRQEGVLRSDQGRVLGSGSLSGVDASRFAPNDGSRVAVRSELGIDETSVIFLFLGRLNRDKGIGELAAAWTRIAVDWPDANLLVVGEDEEALGPTLAQMERTITLPSTPQPERYIAASDVLCLPSKREGFGTVVIEAACAGSLRSFLGSMA